jgi:hypothetical protein
MIQLDLLVPIQEDRLLILIIFHRHDRSRFSIKDTKKIIYIKSITCFLLKKLFNVPQTIFCNWIKEKCYWKKKTRKIFTRFFQLILSFKAVCTINNIKRVPYSGKRRRNSLIILGWTTDWWGIGSSSSFPFLDFSFGLEKRIV